MVVSDVAGGDAAILHLAAAEKVRCHGVLGCSIKMSLKRPQGPAGPLLVLDHSSKILKGKSLRGITISPGNEL